MDVIGVFSAGVKEVVASCGTALTEAQVRAMHRHADTVIINFDPDKAGANAAEKSIQLFVDEGMHIRILSLDGGLDPDEYVKQNGADAYRAKLDSAATFFHWLADRARARFDMQSSDGRMEAFKKVLMPAMQQIPDKLERAAVASDLAGYLGVEPGLILDQLKRAAAERRAPSPQAQQPAAVVPAIERMLLSALISSEEARAEMLPQLPDSITSNFATCEIFAALRHMNGGPLVFSALEGRLTPPSRALLHHIVAADEIVEGSQALDRARACLRRLESDLQKRRIADLRAKVKAAEREGRIEEALRWMSELK
jgi:DNA primase